MPDHFGRHGFKRPQRMIKEIITISFMEINERFEEFRTKGFVTEEDGAVLLDLKALKYDKLLSKGAPETPFSVKVDQISGGAREKIESMGGKVLSE
jgi:large subunit ribosomal protein L15